MKMFKLYFFSSLWFYSSIAVFNSSAEHIIFEAVYVPWTPSCYRRVPQSLQAANLSTALSLDCMMCSGLLGFIA